MLLTVRHGRSNALRLLASVESAGLGIWEDHQFLESVFSLSNYYNVDFPDGASGGVMPPSA
jgi:hypothetical protein